MECYREVLVDNSRGGIRSWTSYVFAFLKYFLCKSLMLSNSSMKIFIVHVQVYKLLSCPGNPCAVSVNITLPSVDYSKDSLEGSKVDSQSVEHPDLL